MTETAGVGLTITTVAQTGRSTPPFRDSGRVNQVTSHHTVERPITEAR